MFKNQLLPLYAIITMDVTKNQQLFTRLICGYCNGCKKTKNYLRDLYVGITMAVKKPTTIYKTYMWVLHIWNGFMQRM